MFKFCLSTCRFGHLSCSASDVEIYLHMLSGNEMSELLDEISGSFDASLVSVNTLGLTITLFKVQELLGTLFTKPNTGLQVYLCQCVTCFYFCVLSYLSWVPIIFHLYMYLKF